MKYGRLLACLLLVLGTAGAQKLDPVQWSLAAQGSAKVAPGSSVLLRLTAHIQPGWHIYSLTNPAGGAGNPTVIQLAEGPAVSGLVGVYQPKPQRKLDPNFNAETETFEGEPVFLLEVKLKPDAGAGPVKLVAQVRYYACQATLCLPPKRKEASATLTVAPGAPAAAISIPPGYTEFKPGSSGPAPSAQQNPAQQNTAQQNTAQQNQDLGAFLLIAFGVGLAAIFTPCVFPMIPITVSYFLNRQDSGRRDAVIHALLFSVGIIVLFCLLGLGVTAIAGPFGVVQLGSSPWVNGFISIVFLVFGLSLLGAFEITLPSGLLTSLDKASQRGGYIGTLLMGLTFCLTSFACIGPIVGPLLVSSVQDKGARPVLGMLCFATGLALPFFLLALFPSYLQRLPRSGGWLARVKVVMGFIVLGVLLKYLSNIDAVLQWNLITRDRFLAAWIVLSALAGLYLLGFLRLEGINPDDRLGVTRLLVACAFLVFSISLIPGLFNSPLPGLEAYVPAATGPAFGGASTGERGAVWLKNDYQGALAKARQENKLVLVSFTGYACTNCHWMKANMFTRPEIAQALQSFVLVELYTDGTDEASRLNQELQEKKFGTVAIPFYAVVDPDQKVIATSAGLTSNTQRFLAFLKTGQAVAETFPPVRP
ncbi:MAG TPA: cytochrome c biogenesis protein CcdA [Bryobacteraceae bacterium]|nr:cytochrome c biogenesis protein CcdA [Bryobacteraceae bacterium]